MTKSVLKDIFPGLDPYIVLQDIIGAVNIVESGDELIHSCPLPLGMHKNGDRNPSASLNKETLLFNCFTCGGGSVIWLVQNCLNVSKEQAISILKEEVADLKVISTEDFIKKIEDVFDHHQLASLDIPVYSENLLKRWQGECDYLTVRGVSEAVQREMRTGVERNRPEISKSSGEESTVLVDRVVLPHFMNGKLVGWVARKINDVNGVPKYRNSKGFPRGSWLYNLDNNLHTNEVFVVESPMSVLVLKSRGIDNVVATFGAKVDKQQIALLRDFERVNIFMDGDDPGRMATEHLIESLSPYTKLGVIETADDEDPATLMEVPEVVSAYGYQMKKSLTYSR
jgi:DNA primase